MISLVQSRGFAYVYMGYNTHYPLMLQCQHASGECNNVCNYHGEISCSLTNTLMANAKLSFTWYKYQM